MLRAYGFDWPTYHDAGAICARSSRHSDQITLYAYLGPGSTARIAATLRAMGHAADHRR